MRMQSFRWRGGETGWVVYLLPAGSLTLLDSHALGVVSRVVSHVVICNPTYQSLKDALACCRAAGLDFPYVVLGDLP